MNEEKIYNVISGIDEDLTDRSLSRKTQTKAEKRRTFRWLYAAAAALAVCVMAALPILSPLLRSPDSPVIDPPARDTCSESSVGDPVDAQTEEPIAYTEYEPPVWAIVANRPFAILKIHEITNEKIILSQNPTSSNDRSYVKITVEIVAAYHTEEFSEGDLVRAFKRTIDVLRQFCTIDGIPPEIAKNASLAIDCINRDPIKED